MPAFVAPPPKGKLPPVDLSKEKTTGLTRKDLEPKHPEYLLNQEQWFHVQVLYEGGATIRRVADRFLKRRPKEDQTVYQHRVDQFSYENNLGAGLGWHEAQMFENDPTIDVKVKKADGSPSDAELPADAKDFYNQKFLKNCDRNGTAFVDLFRKVFNHLCLFGSTFISVDLPARDENTPVQTLQDERAQNLLDPYTCVISPQDVINWDKDEAGNYLWVLIYGKTEQQNFLKPPTVVERWYWYDRQQYRVYECRYDKENSSTITDVGLNSAPVTTTNLDIDKKPVELVRAGYHPLAFMNTVPLVPVSVPPGWYMGNRAYLPALEHLNVSNALKWSLFMAALAVPVLITDDEVSSLTQTEAGFIKLGLGSDYKFAEPTGNCWDHLAKRAQTLKEEIWRALYLVSQARNTSATASAQSGVSKQQDMAPSHDVLNGLGDVLRATMQKTLEWVAAARAFAGFETDKNLTFDVRGFAFEEKLSTDEIAVIQDLLNMQIPSDLFEKELFVLAVRAALRDANPETLGKIVDQIMAAKDRLGREMDEENARTDMLQQRMATTMAKDDPEGVGTN